MVDRGRRSALARVLAPAGFVVGDILTLDSGTAHHLRVLRLQVGESVALTDGAGLVGSGIVHRLARSEVDIAVETRQSVSRPTPVHMAVPVADRDRMLWLAEKSTELAATSWRPVLWQRSASVSPSGKGAAFRDKVGARMASALIQSGGAWLPEQFTEESLEDALAAFPPGAWLLLDQAGMPIVPAIELRLDVPVTIITGPEGGIEEGERDRLVAQGAVRVSLAETILRFETAALSALAVVRAVLSRRSGSRPANGDQPGGKRGE